jgi:hypothetical protein
VSTVATFPASWGGAASAVSDGATGAYVSFPGQYVVRRVFANGISVVVAGSTGIGASGTTGDGGVALWQAITATPLALWYLIPSQLLLLRPPCLRGLRLALSFRMEAEERTLLMCLATISGAFFLKTSLLTASLEVDLPLTTFRRAKLL